MFFENSDCEKNFSMSFRLHFDISNNNVHIARKKSHLVHYLYTRIYNHDIQNNCILVSRYVRLRSIMD